MQTKTKVAVIFGGKSGEHEVSLTSAHEVISGFDRKHYEAIPIGVSKQGRWHLCQFVSDKPLKIEGPELVLPLRAGEKQFWIFENNALRELKVDIVFPMIHGTTGEDGCLQGLLEMTEIPYVGAGVLGSAIGMDKGVMKALMKQAGLPVVDYCVVMRDEWSKNPKEVQQRVERSLPALPWFVKPACLGSSVGITKVKRMEDFAKAMDFACCTDQKIIIEAGVDQAREIEVSVLGNLDPEVSQPGEVIPSQEFYDYRAKYLDNTSRLITPAQLPELVVERIRQYAKTAFQVCHCLGMARVDFLVRGSDHAIFVSEINTIPGFTRISLYPKLWQLSGLSFSALLDKLIQLAFAYHSDKTKNCRDYQSLYGSLQG